MVKSSLTENQVVVVELHLIRSTVGPSLQDLRRRRHHQSLLARNCSLALRLVTALSRLMTEPERHLPADGVNQRLLCPIAIISLVLPIQSIRGRPPKVVTQSAYRNTQQRFSALFVQSALRVLITCGHICVPILMNVRLYVQYVERHSLDNMTESVMKGYTLERRSLFAKENSSKVVIGDVSLL